MKRRGKRVLLGMVLLVAALAVVVFVVGRVPRMPEQIVTLPDGRQYRVVAVTWGTNHSQPRVIARLIDHLPDSLAKYCRRKLTPRLGDLTPKCFFKPSLCLWLKPIGTNSMGTKASFHMLEGVICDENGVAGGDADADVLMDPKSEYAIISEFPVVPRRNPVLDFRFRTLPSATGTRSVEFQVHTPNPLYGNYPQWKPEALPITKRVGDLAITLTNLFLRQSIFYSGQPNQPDQEHLLLSAVAGFAFNSTAGTNETWVRHWVDLDDATGNDISSYLGSLTLQFPKPDVHGHPRTEFGLGGALWPGEDAWRIRLRMKRLTGYAAEDIVTFTNVPLPKPSATNGVLLTNWTHGIPLVLQTFSEVARYGDGPIIGPYFLQIYLPDRSTDIAVDYLETTTDKGATPQESGLGTTAWRALAYRSFPPGTRSLNVTFLVQKVRTFDFYVKPPAVTNLY